MSAAMTPEESLKNHPVRRELIAGGWTAEELDASRFFNWNPVLPFQTWPMAPSKLPRQEDFGLVRAYLALRWLVLDDPPASRNRDDAWAYVADVIAAPLVASGLAHSEAQRKRARAPRGILADGEPTLDQLIGNLATKPEYADLKPSELWPHLIAELDELGLAPTDAPESGKARDIAIEYNGRPKPTAPDAELRRKTIGYGRFCNVVSKSRRKPHPSRADA